MKHTTQTELDIKINTFLARKTGEHPELIKAKEVAWSKSFNRSFASRLFA